MFGRGKTKADAERKKVLARLAATETAGLINRAVETTRDEDQRLAVARRVQETGTLGGDNFVGSIRPKYCTVNFPALNAGVGAQWGRSHLVLAPHLKLNMSFIHSDSFDIAGGGRMLVGRKLEKATPQRVQRVLASYHNMTRLIANMPAKMLDALCDAASGTFAAGQTWSAFNDRYGLGKTAYIEGHIHAEIHMARDLAKLRICKGEVAGSRILNRRVEKFGSRFGVKIEYFT